MEKLIFASLVLLILIEVVSLINNAYTWQRNFVTTGRNIEHLEKENKRLAVLLKSRDFYISRLELGGVAFDAFAITNEGVKALPKNWKAMLLESEAKKHGTL